MMAYYESPNATPPAHLLPAIARPLGVSIEQLYGHGTPKRRLAKQEGDSRLRRRLLAIEKLDPNEKRVLHLIDASDPQFTTQFTAAASASEHSFSLRCESGVEALKCR
jgi:hypothetical protein